jgi:hypothetical protein
MNKIIVFAFVVCLLASFACKKKDRDPISRGVDWNLEEEVELSKKIEEGRREMAVRKKAMNDRARELGTPPSDEFLLEHGSPEEKKEAQERIDQRNRENI